MDECNGATIDGEYAYFLTEEFPFIPRCHVGVTAAGDGAGGGGGAEGPDAAAGAEEPGDTAVMAPPVDAGAETTGADAAAPAGTRMVDATGAVTSRFSR